MLHDTSIFRYTKKSPIMTGLIDTIVFLLSISVLMVVARKTMWGGFMAASLILGLFTLPFPVFLKLFPATFGDPSILLLSFSVGIIPLIGGTLQEGGLMERFVRSLRVSRKGFMAASPAFLGCLPMPGGALLSAPLVDYGGEDISPDLKGAVNVWFRHVLILIYPLGTLLATSKMAEVSLYRAVAWTLPFFLIMVAAGWLLLLRSIPGTMPGESSFQSRASLQTITTIVLAPVVHFTLSTLFPHVMTELFLFLGVFLSLGAAVFWGFKDVPDSHSLLEKSNRHFSPRLTAFLLVIRKMKSWRYVLLVLWVFFFMYTFQETEITTLIADLHPSRLALFVGFGTLLGLATGRVNLPVAVLVPIHVSLFGAGSMTALEFAILHFSVFTGYVISPIHPCILVTLEYFSTDYLRTLRLLALPTLICVSAAFAAGLLLLGR